MANWSPPAIPRVWLLLGGGLWLLWMVYALLVIQQVLLGVFPAFLFVGLYLLWRFLAAFEAIADAQQRLADQRERENE